MSHDNVFQYNVVEDIQKAMCLLVHQSLTSQLFVTNTNGDVTNNKLTKELYSSASTYTHNTLIFKTQKTFSQYSYIIKQQGLKRCSTPWGARYQSAESRPHI